MWCVSPQPSLQQDGDLGKFCCVALEEGHCLWWMGQGCAAGKPALMLAGGMEPEPTQRLPHGGLPDADSMGAFHPGAQLFQGGVGVRVQPICQGTFQAGQTWQDPRVAGAARGVHAQALKAMPDPVHKRTTDLELAGDFLGATRGCQHQITQALGIGVAVLVGRVGT